jgi:predicted nucleic acid-binding protein
VLAAGNSEIRAQRLATLESVADMEALPGRVRINDLWIAAIAASRDLPVITQDNDFDALDGAANLIVIRV